MPKKPKTDEIIWRDEFSMRRRLEDMDGRGPPRFVWAVPTLVEHERRDGMTLGLYLVYKGGSVKDATHRAWVCLVMKASPEEKIAIETLAILRFNLGDML